MKRFALAALLVGPFQDSTPVDAVKAAIEATAKSSYAYRVGGRFKREGVFTPPDLLGAHRRIPVGPPGNEDPRQGPRGAVEVAG